MPKTIKFEDSIKRLQEIVEKLEEGNIDMDESIQLYEEGIGLANSCSKKLEKIENKISLLQESQKKTSIKKSDR
ncbi:MAG: exodeoxyribonuclease VII small subunit [Candidatus Cloacimonadota bacterium]|nr:exodeoxyribonuclease VII small subunit [Candidatus Cloacimonadota bacterium]